MINAFDREGFMILSSCDIARDPLPEHVEASLRASAVKMRADCLRMANAAGNEGAHLGGAFSCIEILAALYLEVMNFNPKKLDDPSRDRFVFSKGHGVQAQYAVFRQLGLVSEDELDTFKRSGSFLTGHPSMNPERGIEYSSGSLGQGLSLGVGSCLAMRQLGNDRSRVFVLLGDGECDEGQVWEAAMSACHYRLDNLVAIIDRNWLQYDGKTEDVVSLGSLGDKWRAFGWAVLEVDGHNFSELVPALNHRADGEPLAIIANTVKGKGISFTENVVSWHHSRLTPALYEQAEIELEEVARLIKEG